MKSNTEHKMSKKEEYDNIVIKNRFRYEDLKYQSNIPYSVEKVVGDLEDINDSLDEIVESERDRRRRKRNQIHHIKSWNEVYHVLLVSLIGLTLVLVITVLCSLCSKLCFNKDLKELNDPERVVLVSPLVL